MTQQSKLLAIKVYPKKNAYAKCVDFTGCRDISPIFHTKMHKKTPLKNRTKLKKAVPIQLKKRK